MNRLIFMLQKNTLQFLRQLKANNTKEWMDRHRDVYLSAKADFEQFTGKMLQVLARREPALGTLQIKDCTFRINRDICFTQNKAPYKTNMGWYIAVGGKKSPFAGYYCHIEPGQCFFAGGLWMPMPDALKKVRQEIDYNYEAFQKIISEKKFKASFGDLEKGEGYALSRPPKGYEAENPAIAYLKLKSFIASAPLTDKAVIAGDLLIKLDTLCSNIAPLVSFLNTALEADENE